MRKLEILSHDDICRIHLSTLEVLENIGIRFPHEGALKIFEGAGATVDHERKLVKIPEYLVNEALDRAPSQVVFLARDPKYNIRIGSGQIHFTNGYGADHVLDLENGQRRPATLKDLDNFTLMSDALSYVHYVMTNIIPQDVPKTVCDRYITLSMFRNTSKHVCVTSLDLDGLKDIIRMAAILVGGEEEFRKKPAIINTGFSSVPPLQFSEDVIARIIEVSKYRIPFEMNAGVLSGASGPVTLAGTLVQVNAEDMAGLVLSQLVGPGTPVIYGSLASILDMKYGTASYGSPECGLINVAFTQMAHYYRLPYFGTAGIIDSKVPDEQAAYECAINNLMAALAGADIIHDGVYGILETGKTACYEQFIVGHEIVSMVMRLVEGIRVNDDTLALDVIGAVGAGGNYLKEMRAVRHTRKHLLEEHWQPELTDRTLRSEWEEKGSKDILQRAREKVKRILETHKPEPLSEEVEARLNEAVKEAVKEHI